ncbi:MAG: chromate transporter [Cellulosilyticaceae bacterium]
MIYLTLFLEFFKTGLFTIGGGLATIPFLQEMVVRYGWITEQQLLNIIAVAESTPGPIGINAATYMGYETAGIWGSLIAVAGTVVPSIIVIVLIAHFFERFKNAKLVRGAFDGIRPLVAALIGVAGLEVAKVTLQQTEWFKVVLLFALAVYGIEKFKKHPIVYLVGGAVIGIVFKF